MKNRKKDPKTGKFISTKKETKKINDFWIDYKYYFSNKLAIYSNIIYIITLLFNLNSTIEFKIGSILIALLLNIALIIKLSKFENQKIAEKKEIEPEKITETTIKTEKNMVVEPQKQDNLMENEPENSIK